MPADLALFGGPTTVDKNLYVRWPIVGETEKASLMQALQRVVDRGILSGHLAPEIRALEREFAEYLGVKYAVATNSGTAALHIALAAAGVGPGDEVITPAFSFVATALAVLHQNAIPVFVDIEPETFGMDPRLIEAAITPRTRALLPVHMHGLACDLKPMLAIAEKHGLKLIEDAAQAHGSTLDGRKVGTFGALAAFSLQSSKNLAGGEGGICVTDDERLALKASSARMFGEDIQPGDEAAYRIDRALDGTRAYDSKGMGWMYRTNELSAAVARTQLRRLDESNENGQANAELLGRRLRELPGVTPPTVPPGRTSVFHKYRVRLDANALGLKAPATRVRDWVLKALVAEGVEAVLWQTRPVPGQTLFREKIGFGRNGTTEGPGCPWDHGRPVSYDLAQYPETTRLLDGSLCLFSQTCPIYAQPRALAEQYADAFAKVWDGLPSLLDRAEKGAAR
jgi:dTDP-4-amino-4,6-dideoxygalactose transaminase